MEVWFRLWPGLTVTISQGTDLIKKFWIFRILYKTYMEAPQGPQAPYVPFQYIDVRCGLQKFNYFSKMYF
jgi:hypothetical protein